MVRQRFDNIPGQIAKILADRIIRGELAPGARILEQSVSDEMGVSRSPVREAFLILQRQRLVEILPRRGARVTEISPSSIESLYDLLTELYGLVASKAARNHNEEDVRSLREKVKKAKECAKKGDALEYYQALFEYERAALEASKDSLLQQTLADMNAATRRVQYATLTKRVDDLTSNAAFLERAADHAEAGEEEKAGQTMRAYIQNEKDSAMRLLVKEAG